MIKEEIKQKIQTIQKTVKKSKFIGTKELIDPDTGEVYPMQINQIEDRDFNFHKLWLRNFIYGLENITNQKMTVAFWIIENLDENNLLIATQRRIARETGISLSTVSYTMTALQEGDTPFLTQIQQGVYRVNPEIIFKGSHPKRMGICFVASSEAKRTPRKVSQRKAQENQSKQPSLE